jgi:pantoate--beta-alanine ligase
VKIDTDSMKVFDNVNDLQSFLNLEHNGIPVGFVPTMGALHSGHLSLIKRALSENGLVVCSIFVNPTQFNDPEDLKNYPRTLHADLKLLEGHENLIVFAPTVHEVYPQGMEKPLEINFGKLEQVMEGIYRPGHFKGVATVVSRLFEIVKPTKAYFGLKDFQQLAIIKNMVNQLSLPVEIISCPTQREEDGLAMSSRNRNLSSGERKAASAIPAILEKIKSSPYRMSPSEAKELVARELIKDSLLKLDYFEIADPETLQPLEKWNPEGNNVACIAVFAGKVRLIDNIAF